MPIKAEGRRLCSGCHTSLQRLSIVQWVSHFPSQATDCAVAVALPYRDYLLCSGWRTSLPSRPDRAPEVIARSHRRGVLLRTTHHLIYMYPTIIVPSKQFKVNFLYLIYLMGKWGDCLKNNALKLSIHSRSRHFRSLELISEVPRSFPSLQAHFRGCLTPIGKISAQWNVLEQIPCWAWGKNSFLALKWKFLAGLGVEIPSRTITTVGLHQTPTFEMLDSDWLHPDPALPFIRELQAHQSSVVLWISPCEHVILIE